MALSSNTDEREAVVSGVSSEYKKCPFCAEAVRKEAMKCKHCGSDLSAKADTAKAKIDAEPNYDNYQVTMDHYGITFRLEKFWFDKKPFEQLVDAVNYARLNPV